MVDTQSAGIWVETVDESISITDTLYVSLSAGDQGKITKTVSADAIPLTGYASILDAQSTLFDGRKIILISYRN